MFDGLTGTIIAFENDIPHWLHPDLFYVRPGPTALPEHDLVRIVEQRFAPTRVGDVQILRRANLAHVAQLPGGVSVTHGDSGRTLKKNEDRRDRR